MPRFLIIRRRALHVFLRERRDDLAVWTDALAHHQHVAPRHDQFGRIPVELESGNALGAAAAEHVAKALGGDQRGLDAFALENGVGGDRGAVAERERLLAANAGARQAVDHAVEEGGWRRCNLADPLLAGLQIDPDHIGECTADVGADHPHALAAHALRSTPDSHHSGRSRPLMNTIRYSDVVNPDTASPWPISAAHD
jgi:hypothetical protein